MSASHLAVSNERRRTDRNIESEEERVWRMSGRAGVGSGSQLLSLLGCLTSEEGASASHGG